MFDKEILVDIKTSTIERLDEIVYEFMADNNNTFPIIGKYHVNDMDGVIVLVPSMLMVPMAFDNNVISFPTSILYMLDETSLQFLAFHEIGHIVNAHGLASERTGSEILKAEFEADNFAFKNVNISREKYLEIMDKMFLSVKNYLSEDKIEASSSEIKLRCENLFGKAA